MTEVGVKAKLKVLIVDDERFVRFTLSAILRSAGYEVADAGSSEEGLNKLKRDQFHVIVTDVMMGAIDGFMFRDGIRDFNKTIPIIFLTSLVNEDDRLMKQVMDNCAQRNVREWGNIKSAMRDALSDYIYQKTKRSPMILPVIMEV